MVRAARDARSAPQLAQGLAGAFAPPGPSGAPAAAIAEVDSQAEGPDRPTAREAIKMLRAVARDRPQKASPAVAIQGGGGMARAEGVEGQRGSWGGGLNSSTFSLLPWFFLLTGSLPRPSSHPSTTAPPRTSFPLLPWRRLRRLAPSARNSANSIDASSAQHLLLKPFALRNLGTCAPTYYWPTFRYSQKIGENSNVVFFFKYRNFAQS